MSKSPSQLGTARSAGSQDRRTASEPPAEQERRAGERLDEDRRRATRSVPCRALCSCHSPTSCSTTLIGLGVTGRWRAR